MIRNTPIINLSEFYYIFSLFDQTSKMHALTLEETRRLATTAFADRSGDFWRSLPEGRKRVIAGNEDILGQQFLEILTDVLLGTPVEDAVEQYEWEIVFDDQRARGIRT